MSEALEWPLGSKDGDTADQGRRKDGSGKDISKGTDETDVFEYMEENFYISSGDLVMCIWNYASEKKSTINSEKTKSHT